VKPNTHLQLKRFPAAVAEIIMVSDVRFARSNVRRDQLEQLAEQLTNQMANAL